MAGYSYGAGGRHSQLQRAWRSWLVHAHSLGTLRLCTASVAAAYRDGCCRRRPEVVVSNARGTDGGHWLRRGAVGLVALNQRSRKETCERSPIHGDRRSESRACCLRLSVVCGLLGCGDCPVGVAYLEAGEAAHGDVFAELADLLRDELRDGHGLLLDEGLIEQTDLFVELAHLAFHDLLDYWRRLAGCGGLGAVDLLLALHVLHGDVLLADVAWVGGGDVHRNVLEQ